MRIVAPRNPDGDPPKGYVSACGGVRSDRPFGGSRRPSSRFILAPMMLEIGLLAAIVIFFVVTDLYVRGAEKI
jgi:hypothetical protein